VKIVRKLVTFFISKLGTKNEYAFGDTVHV